MFALTVANTHAEVWTFSTTLFGAYAFVVFFLLKGKRLLTFVFKFSIDQRFKIMLMMIWIIVVWQKWILINEKFFSQGNASRKLNKYVNNYFLLDLFYPWTWFIMCYSRANLCCLSKIVDSHRGYYFHQHNNSVLGDICSMRGHLLIDIK